MQKRGTLVRNSNLEPRAFAGWSALGSPVAGARDTVTGSLEPRAGVPSSAATLRKLLALAGGMAAVAALYFGKDVLVPITLAIMLSFILSPMVNLLQRLRLWRGPSVILTVLAALGLIGALGTLIGMQAAALSVNAPEYAKTIETKVGALQASASGRIEALTKALSGGRKLRRPPIGAQQGLERSIAAAVGTVAPRPPVVVEVAPPKTTPLSVARTILEPLVGPLETTFIVLMVAIFVLMQKEDLRDRFIRVFGSNDLHRTTLALDDAGKRLSRYFIAQLAVNTAFGVVIAIGLWALGVPSPVMWGVLAGMLRFVPYIGSVLAAVAPVALGAAIDPGWSTAIFIALYFVIVESIIGYVVEPLLYGHSTCLSPVSVIVSAIFWTWLWGPVGLILSTPLTLCLVVLGRHVKALEVFDVVLGDRPALTPVESFYQRLLASNTDEALAQAETMLTEMSLLEYYDNVVLAALRLAAADAAMGTVDGVRLDQMRRAIRVVTDDLDGHSDSGSAPIQLAETEPPGAIACIAGRGILDDVATTMLGQILEQRGLKPVMFAHDAASPGAIGSLDLRDTKLIVVCYLELVGSPTHLRFLLRRLRQKAPGVAIVVGLWSEPGPLLVEDASPNAAGADRNFGSFTDAIAAIAELRSVPAPTI